jgi:hypothetical protein
MAHSTIKRKCDHCAKEYDADMRNVNRGWGLCCSKSCAAKKREESKPGYNPERVAANNIRRDNWNVKDENHYGSFRGRYTSEGYKIYGTTAMDEWGEPVYEVDEYADDPGDSEYWDSKDYN